MAIGKESGSFALKATSVTYAPDTVQVNYDGTAEGFGRVQGTMTFRSDIAGAKSGRCNWSGAAYLESGEIVGGSAEGTWEEVGKHKWRVRAINYLSNGRSFITDGEVDLAADAYTGAIYAWD